MGFCSWLRYQLLRITVGGFLSCRHILRHDPAQPALAPGAGWGDQRWQKSALSKNRLHGLHVPRIEWKTRLTVVAATALVAICATSRPFGFTPVPSPCRPSPFCCWDCSLPRERPLHAGAFTGGRRRWLPVFSPHGPGGIAQLLGPTGGYCFPTLLRALTSLLYAWPSFVLTRSRPLGWAHGHSCCRYLARAAHHLKFSVVFRSVGRTVPPRRCRQDPRRTAW